MNDILLTLSYFIHLISTVVWIGGLLAFVVFIWPLAHQTMQRSSQNDFVLAFNKRFRPLANLSLLLLLGTGMLQIGANENYDGLLTFNNTWTIAMLFKHIAFVGMMIVAGLVQFAVVPAIEQGLLLAKKDDGVALQAAIERETNLARIMLGLGIVVLIFTAIATAV